MGARLAHARYRVRPSCGRRPAVAGRPLSLPPSSSLFLVALKRNQFQRFSDNLDGERAEERATAQRSRSVGEMRLVGRLGGHSFSEMAEPMSGRSNYFFLVPAIFPAKQSNLAATITLTANAFRLLFSIYNGAASSSSQLT